MIRAYCSLFAPWKIVIFIPALYHSCSTVESMGTTNSIVSDACLSLSLIEKGFLHNAWHNSTASSVFLLSTKYALLKPPLLDEYIPRTFFTTSFEAEIRNKAPV